MMKSIQTLFQVREKFIQQIQSLSIIEEVYPPETNFVLIRFVPKVELYRDMLTQGVITRSQAHELLITHKTRLSIGSAQTMQKTFSILTELEKVYAC